jgi:hypothetical protein
MSGRPSPTKGKHFKQWVHKKCPCGIEFDVLPCNANRSKFCSRKCSYEFTDWSTLHKQAYASGKESVGGGYTKWYTYDCYRIQGTYELRTCKILDVWKTAGLIKDWEYTKDRVPYAHLDGTMHTYFLDFKVLTNDNKILYIEVKGYKREHDEEKWNAIRALGFQLEIWYIKNIECYEIHSSRPNF